MAKNHQFSIHKKRLNIPTIALFFFLIVMLTPIISGMEFDNRKEIINEKGFAGYNDLKIRNFFGYGKTLWEGSLNTNTENCAITCESTQTIRLYETGSLIDNIMFKTLQEDGTWIEQGIRSYEIYVNGNPYILGTEMNAGTYEVKLIGKKKPSRTVDWIYETQGESLDEWATWYPVFDTTIIYYDFDTYTLEGANGSIEEKVKGNLNLTNRTSIILNSADGIINNGTRLDNDGSWYLNNTNLPEYYDINSTGNWTMNMWLNLNSTATQDIFVFSDVSGLYYLQIIAGGTVRFDWLASAYEVTGFLMQPNRWYMLTLVSNNSNYSAKDIYINGVYNLTLTIPKGLNLTGIFNDGRFLIGDGGNGGNATFDEFGIWNSSLNSTYISDLYNSGAGLGYGLSGFSVTLNSPPDDNESIIKNIQFNGTATTVGATLVNMSLWHNATGVWHRNRTINILPALQTTNTSIINQTINAIGNHAWNIEACDTDGDCTFATANRTISISNVLILNETYVASTTSGVINNFLLELETDGTPVTIGYLHYNNTKVLGSINNSGNYYNITRNQIALGVSTTTNISFFWNITMDDGNNFVIDPKNQTVSPVVINETCTGMYTIFNFTIVDEITQKKMDATTNITSVKVDLDLYTSNRVTLVSEFYHEFDLINPVAICIDNNLSNGEQYSVDVQIQYSAGNYSSEFYNIERRVLNSSLLYSNITLYNLDTTHSQNFRLIARDTSYLPIDGALIQIERKYIENGSFYITEIPKADVKGITSASLQLNDVIYNFYIYQDGVLISSFTNQLAICQTPLVSSCEIDFNAFNTGMSADFEEGEDFQFTLNYNDTSKVITSQFLIPSGEPSIVYLEVIREDTLGAAVCSDTITSASGTLNCVVPVAFGNSTVMAKIYKDSIEQGKGSIKTDQNPSDIFGVVLIMMSVLVMMTLIGIGVSDNPVITGVFIFVGLILMVSMNLVKNTGFIGVTATILFFLIAIILVIIKAARRS